MRRPVFWTPPGDLEITYLKGSPTVPLDSKRVPWKKRTVLPGSVSASHHLLTRSTDEDLIQMDGGGHAAYFEIQRSWICRMGTGLR